MTVPSSAKYTVYPVINLLVTGVAITMGNNNNVIVYLNIEIARFISSFFLIPVCFYTIRSVAMMNFVVRPLHHRVVSDGASS